MEYNTIECLGIILIALMTAGGWVYRKLKSSPPAPTTVQVQPSATPIPTALSQTTKARWLPLSLASAIAAFITMSLASLAAAIWIGIRPDMPPDMGEGMGYAAGLFICVAGPLISFIAGGLSAISHYVVREFQARDLPLSTHLVLGAVVGLISTLIPAAFLAANTCIPGLPC